MIKYQLKCHDIIKCHDIMKQEKLVKITDIVKQREYMLGLKRRLG